ncbi:DoxX family protein [Gordonia phosphorivorans]|uniref:DoxX family protein n=1 Tax=Gordonia phosphorivorans TaxID=1056982 RepID=A0ABV6HD06_9ACTN
MILRKIARPLLASAFVASGAEALLARQPVVTTAQPLVDAGRDALPAEVAQVVPANAATALRINGAVQIGGGLLLATGRIPRVASAVLAGTLVPATVYDGAFWTETDPLRREVRKVSFVKNLGLLGGVLLASADTEGKPSLAWRGRRTAHEAKIAMAAALPGSTDAHELGDRAAEWADRAAEWADVGRGRAEILAVKAAERAPLVAEQARHRAEEIALMVGDRAPVVADEIRHRAEDQVRGIRRRLRR